MSSEKLKALRKAAKAYQGAYEALIQAYKTNASGFELVRLGRKSKRLLKPISIPSPALPANHRSRLSRRLLARHSFPKSANDHRR